MQRGSDSGGSERRREPRTRRDFLKYGGAAAAGLVAGAMLPQDGAEADNGDPLVLGQQNFSTANTVLNGNSGLLIFTENEGASYSASLAADTGVGVAGIGSDVGVQGTSDGGVGGEFFGAYVGVRSVSRGGENPEEGFGIKGEANNPGGTGVSGEGDFRGVSGLANDGDGVGVRGEAFGSDAIGVQGEGGYNGVFGHAMRGAGVSGFSESVEGVAGGSAGGFGVVGYGGRGGVRGVAEADKPAVSAWSGVAKGNPDNGLALEVEGQARFSNAGQGVVPAGRNQSDPISPPNGLRGPSHVLVTLTSNPKGIRTAQWVEVRQDDFIVHLTPTAPPNSAEVTFTYLVIELPEVIAAV
jgi:hypothetical protein